jgi:hypothetical protein
MQHTCHKPCTPKQYCTCPHKCALCCIKQRPTLHLMAPTAAARCVHNAAHNAACAQRRSLQVSSSWPMNVATCTNTHIAQQLSLPRTKETLHALLH